MLERFCCVCCCCCCAIPLSRNARRYGRSAAAADTDADTAAETTRCRDTERANEGPPVVATRARWRVVSSYVECACADRECDWGWG